MKRQDPEETFYYSWSQMRGSKEPLLDVNMPRASFLAPPGLRETALPLQAARHRQERRGQSAGVCGRDR